MRIIITGTTVIAMSLIALDLSFAQPWSQTNTYSRCVELASRQGLSAKSASGRRFVNRCMQRRTYVPRETYGSSPNCPDDPRARSAYPAWMCR
jgi:hypothetical protein